MGIAVIEGEIFRPSQLDSAGLQPLLEGGESLRTGVDRARRFPGFKAVDTQCTCSFPDIPLHRVQPVATVRQVSGADVLGRRQDIFEADRNQRPQRYPERQRRHVDVIVAARLGVKVDSVVTDADRIGVTLRQRLTRTKRGGYVAFDDRFYGADSA